jgi:hypothetical protein
VNAALESTRASHGDPALDATRASHGDPALDATQASHGDLALDATQASHGDLALDATHAGAAPRGLATMLDELSAAERYQITGEVGHGGIGACCAREIACSIGRSRSRSCSSATTTRSGGSCAKR